MTPSTKNWIIAVLVLIVLTGIFFLGYSRYPKWNPPPVIDRDTTYVHDTTDHYIYAIWPWYYEHIDTIIEGSVPTEVDTAAILTAFYSTYQYTRTLEDSSLFIIWQDNISQNKAMPVDRFTYKWNKPLTVIGNTDNSINYSKYIYLGGSINIPDTKYSDISLFYAYQRGLFGVGYEPMVKGGGVKITGAFTLFKIK